MHDTLTVGTRVRLTHPVDRYPHFIAPGGSTGTIVEYGEQMIRVRMDAPVDGAEDWENEIHWWDEPDLAQALLDDVEIVS